MVNPLGFSDEATVYFYQMIDVKYRFLALDRMIGAKKHRTFDLNTDNEYLWLQIRRLIENVTYACIAPDIERYKAVHPSGKIEEDQHAKKILDRLEGISPKSLPQPLGLMITNPNGTKNFSGLEEARQANKKRLVDIFDLASKHLHVMNPWVPGERVTSEKRKETSRHQAVEARNYLRTALWDHYKMGLEFSAGDNPKGLDEWSGAYLVSMGKYDDKWPSMMLASRNDDIPYPLPVDTDLKSITAA